MSSSLNNPILRQAQDERNKRTDLHVSSVRPEPVEGQIPLQAHIQYNPDVLSCLANLSNDEVFTPPDLVNKMLDLLPTELWQNQQAKFLDPVTKSGVFLREIAKRLNEGLKDQIPDQQTRINHIFTQQLYGIAITELTSLLARRSVYCSKTANGQYSICDSFSDPQGNIRYKTIKHTWQNSKCTFCGASQEVYDRATTLESHAYEFIHTEIPSSIFGKNMKFDVIIGNQPYQLTTDGTGGQATPIYNIFVEQAKKLNPRYLSMIIPSRWFAGGMGLNDFRQSMLQDKKLRKLVDMTEATDCFPGVEIKSGVCYFLWDASYNGLCKVKTIIKGELLDESERDIGAYDILIRFNKAISILEKVKKESTTFCNSISYGLNSFGLATNFNDFDKKILEDSLTVYVRGGTKNIQNKKITQGRELLSKYKVLVSKAYNAGDGYPHQVIGKPIISNPNTCCTMTYFVTAAFDNQNEALNYYEKYLRTKFCRFMISIRKNTQDINREKLSFVPIQNFNESWTDEKLYAKYGLTQEEIDFIETMIRPMELGDE